MKLATQHYAQIDFPFFVLMKYTLVFTSSDETNHSLIIFCRHGPCWGLRVDIASYSGLTIRNNWDCSFYYRESKVFCLLSACRWQCWCCKLRLKRQCCAARRICSHFLISSSLTHTTISFHHPWRRKFTLFLHIVKSLRDFMV